MSRNSNVLGVMWLHGNHSEAGRLVACDSTLRLYLGSLRIPDRMTLLSNAWWSLAARAISLWRMLSGISSWGRDTTRLQGELDASSVESISAAEVAGEATHLRKSWPNPTPNEKRQIAETIAAAVPVSSSRR